MIATAKAFVVDALTEAAQRRAADPRASAWVSANAGAGKTKVLTDRVLRLLLDGTPPARILCLTFTKAAAANMSNRVFDRLGTWVTLDDAALSGELETLSGAPPYPADLQRARRLFAHAVETPGGLKIETLHAFCERLLHMFPFEANVPARFTVLDERQTEQAFEDALAAVVTDAFLGSDAALRDALDAIGADTARDTLRQAVRTALKQKHIVADCRRRDAALSQLSASLDIPTGVTIEAIERDILEGGLRDRRALAGRLRTGKPTDEKLADGLIATEDAPTRSDAVEAYRGVFFTGKDEPKAPGSLGTKGVPPDVKEALVAEQARLIALFDKHRAARAFARTHALYALAAEIHARVEARKASLGALDFDDLIGKALDLFRRVEASWVLYKLDRGIDHLLVDEAQDTNPNQWGILRAITAEFIAGRGARDRTRTRFAVGDPKQSIYSFQGAEPRAFETTRQDWVRQSAEAGLAFEPVKLNLSFRSTRAVLRAVDAVFAVPDHLRGLSFETPITAPVHQSARGTMLGAIELWPIVAPEAGSEPDAWTEPVDAPGSHAPPIVVARRVARAIKTWIATGDTTGRRRRPGDILILVRKRSVAFEEVIRALKSQGVPVAGQDRLEVAAHIAVADLVAIGRAGLLPADDLTLAIALKTPLVGFTDDDLLRIAAGRGEHETLEDALYRHAGLGDGAAIHGVTALRQWIALAASEGPFGFYAALLGPLGGRTRLVARLGGEAADAIDVFLGEAAKAEADLKAPCLETFLAPFIARADRGATPLTIKRDMEAARDEVRVMTVHGAKGLEAPLVVLIDGCEPVGGKDPPLLPMDDDPDTALLPIWAGRKTEDCSAMASARERCQARALEEHNRLLYVAMTRAADHLVVAPYRGAKSETPASWCEMVRTGLERGWGPGDAVETADGAVLVWRDGDVHEAQAAGRSEATGIASDDPPAWLHAPVTDETDALPPLTPSRALGAADHARSPERRQGDALARRKGKLVHTLLEHLPGLPIAERGMAGRRFLAARAPTLPEGAREDVVASVLRLLDEPDLAALFSPQARAEVTLSGRVRVNGTERPVFGRIDRMAVLDSAVLVCDFKTGRPPGHDERPRAADLTQIALYASLLRQIYPDRRIVPMLIWTTGPTVQTLGDADIAEALTRIDGL